MMKKIIAIVLSISMLFGVFSLTISAEGTDAEAEYPTCDGDCGKSPTIIIHGILQSTVAYLDENGNYIKENGVYKEVWPPEVDVTSLVKKLIFPLFQTLLLQKDYISEPLAKAAREIMADNTCDENGKPVENIDVVRTNKSLAACNAEERRALINMIPLGDFTARTGISEDHLYYFCYNSFGNALDIASEFVDFIDMVKEQTGHDKVNVVPISMGGTIFNTAMGKYMDRIGNSIDKVIYIVPAANGSKLVADLYEKDFSTDDESLYSTMFPTLMKGEWTAYLINIALRLLKNELVLSLVDSILDVVIDDIFIKCTNLWTLVPYEDFDSVLEVHPDFAEKYPNIYNEVLEYHNYQGARFENLKTLEENGTKIYDIFESDYPLYCIVPNCKIYNADSLIQVESASLGATSCIMGDTLQPSDYVNEKVCTNPEHNHINHVKTVDLSTALYPETTWCFYAQDHEKTARNHVIINLALDIMGDKVVDVHSNPEYPQFLFARDSRGLLGLTAQIRNKVNNNELTEAQKEIVVPALQKMQDALNNNLLTAEEFEAVEDEFLTALVNAGLREPDEQPSFMEVAAGKFLKRWSDRLYEKYGNRGFFELGRK
jgi:hypothetical protein